VGAGKTKDGLSKQRRGCPGWESTSLHPALSEERGYYCGIGIEYELGHIDTDAKRARASLGTPKKTLGHTGMGLDQHMKEKRGDEDGKLDKTI